MDSNRRPLHIWNTLTRSKSLFEPIDAEMVRFYVCGVTVYDHCHIGHGRAYVIFDMIRRVLEAAGYGVRYIQNFTDIDDKIIRRAAERETDTSSLVTEMIDQYFVDMDALNVRRASQYPRATEMIPAMIQMIARLTEKGFAYRLGDDVYFSVDQMPNYGRLSRKVLEDLVSGIRVEVVSGKRNPLDFVLWKSAKPGEPNWESPWGPGRPGWHIECSAMVHHTMGETIDIHGGGHDLIFPHHENEIAQSECCFGVPLSRVWIHNGFVTVDDEKMSKSRGQVVRVSDLLKKWDGQVIRYYLLKTHYRSDLRFSMAGLDESQIALNRLRATVENTAPGSDDFQDVVAQFWEAISDDFNVSECLGILFKASHEMNRCGRGGDVLVQLGEILGLQLGRRDAIIPEDIHALCELRHQARLAKKFQEADEFRDQVLHRGYRIEDTPTGWRVLPAE